MIRKLHDEISCRLILTCVSTRQTLPLSSYLVAFSVIGYIVAILHCLCSTNPSVTSQCHIHVTLMTVYCYNCSILVVTVNLLLSLIYKLSFITGLYVSGTTTYTQEHQSTSEVSNVHRGSLKRVPNSEHLSSVSFPPSTRDCIITNAT